MKWHNLNIGVKISINSGTALVLFVLSLFAILWMSMNHPAVERLFPVAVAALTGAFGGYLFKKSADDKLDVQVAKAGTGDEVNRIKVQAAGGNPAPVDKA